MHFLLGLQKSCTSKQKKSCLDKKNPLKARKEICIVMLYVTEKIAGFMQTFASLNTK